MADKIAVNGPDKKASKQEKTISLFRFIEGLNKLKQKMILQVSEYPWYCPISSFPDDPENIHVFYQDRVEEENTDHTTNVLLSVHKPELQRCPEPDTSFAEWLNPGWESYRNEASIREVIPRPLEQMLSLEELTAEERSRIDEEAKTYAEYFTDSTDRVKAYEAWAEKRTAWAEKQKLHVKTRDFFSDLYKVHTDLERTPETLELIVADGFIRDRDVPAIDHPVLTRRVKIRHDAMENTIYIEDVSVESELYTAMFQSMADINTSSINHMTDELHQNDYHPLDRNETPAFFKVFIHQLSSDSIYSEDGIPDGWQKRDRLLLYQSPCYILRKRMDGTVKAIEQIIENIEEIGFVPNPIYDIVEGGKIDIPEDTRAVSVEEQLAEVGGESVDILLSKEANKEQLEIARRIEHYNAVLVQGPPGTGKTHTIANLMGHFLAQGKSVLVTSHTQKALSVLKEKVAPGLQSLCVSMLDDTNSDMEKSIDGITSCMARSTSFELKREMEALGQERKAIIEELAATRKKLFALINRECNCIVFNGEAVSPSAAAAYVLDNSETLSYIPGPVQPYAPLPLSFAELADLYRSNDSIRASDESELEKDLPDPRQIMSPADFELHWNRLNAEAGRLAAISEENHWEIQNLSAEGKILIDTAFGKIHLDYPDYDAVKQLRGYVSSFGKAEPWMQYCAVDGKKGGAYKQLWILLMEQIQKTCAFSEQLTAERFGKSVKVLHPGAELVSAMEQLREKYQQKGKIGKLDLLFNKQLEIALDGAEINGERPQSAEDCDLILHVLEMEAICGKCAPYWNDLIAKHGGPLFCNLSQSEPERIAANYIPLIQRYLGWYENEYAALKMRMESVGLPCDIVFQSNVADSEINAVSKILAAVESTIPALCDVFQIVLNMSDISRMLRDNQNNLLAGNRLRSTLCRAIASAAEAGNISAYRDAYAELELTYAKYDLKRRRESYLERLTPAAPQWAIAIRDRAGIHGGATVPDNIEDAWRWAQYNSIIEEITSEPFDDLQKRSLSLSKEYRNITAQFAEKSAWYHLLQRTEHDISMRQALVGWKQTVKKIGKGTGKNAPMYRAKARSLMAKCQNAVPGWIMPIGKALESLNPKNNQFDIVIIDEASQSDISSLAILYMGKKLVIVGDDKQVSPMAVGAETGKINALRDMFLVGKIENAHLYDAKTSIYDIAATTFQPLMLREHFRCVPEIIGFSNWLSYDFKIKPLRDDSSSVLLPAVVNYRVADGKRIGKTNPNEARTIVALMQACMEQPEYDGKTFGVISLLGDEQVKVIQAEIYRSIQPQECSKRRLLCGNASDFQGDERDVVFLSVVDCANGAGPLSNQGYGADDAYRKRYNVAASRAKDQLWVVDSLDPANDLKPGDLRKQLIDFSLNPTSVSRANEEIEAKAESPFESAVAKHLAARGYHLVQQWKVGAYRLDMVAVCGKQRVAIECDGERYHSGEEKIRADMERQTILERLGWRFIRIRGSEYYRDPEKAMERVITELAEFGIKPEETPAAEAVPFRETDLLNRVKVCAHRILSGKNISGDQPDIDTIAAALESKDDMAENCTPEETVSAVQTIKTAPAIPEERQTQTPKAFQAVGTWYQEPPAKAKITERPEQIVIPGMEENGHSVQSIIELLESSGVQYIDKRSNNGSLWMIGGKELSDIAAKAKVMGYVFHFKENGGRATKNQPAWWTK